MFKKVSFCSNGVFIFENILRRIDDIELDKKVFEAFLVRLLQSKPSFCQFKVGVKQFSEENVFASPSIWGCI